MSSQLDFFLGTMFASFFGNKLSAAYYFADSCHRQQHSELGIQMQIPNTQIFAYKLKQKNFKYSKEKNFQIPIFYSVCLEIDKIKLGGKKKNSYYVQIFQEEIEIRETKQLNGRDRDES